MRKSSKVVKRGEWTLHFSECGLITVCHSDGSGAVLSEKNANSAAESIFYRFIIDLGLENEKRTRAQPSQSEQSTKKAI